MPTMTAAERRQQAKTRFDAYLADCPTRSLLERLGTKWAALVMSALGDGPKRHSELARQIAGVSQKMLTQTVRELERDGLVTRTLTASVPVRVDYELTELGRSLLPVTRALKEWAEANMAAVLAAHERYDAAS